MSLERGQILNYRAIIDRAFDAKAEERRNRLFSNTPPDGVYSDKEIARLAEVHSLISSTAQRVMENLGIGNFSLERTFNKPKGRFSPKDKTVYYELKFEEPVSDASSEVVSYNARFSYTPRGHFSQGGIHANYVPLAVPRGWAKELSIDIDEAMSFVEDPNATYGTITHLRGPATKENIEGLLQLLLARPKIRHAGPIDLLDPGIY